MISPDHRVIRPCRFATDGDGLKMQSDGIMGLTGIVSFYTIEPDENI